MKCGCAFLSGFWKETEKIIECNRKQKNYEKVVD
jgi:hypothetical protein